MRPDLEKVGRKYALHKATQHRGRTKYECETCAKYENKLTRNKLRRDSE